MNCVIRVFAIPELVPENHISDVSVAIDVLRATTTLTMAVQNGAEKAIPFRTVEETVRARNYFETLKPEILPRLLLGGERKGVLIPGFDLGNSPDAYSEKIIAGKTLLFTTTNGTKAILRGSGTIYLACFLNAQAVVDRIVSLVRQKENEIAARNRTADPDSDFLNIDIQTLEKMSRGRNLKSEKSKRNQKTGKGQGSWRHRPDDIFMEPDSFRISMICAGTDGNYTEEDLLLAGCLTERLYLALSNPANGNTPTEKSDFIPDGRSEENAPYSINKPVFLDVQAETVRELWRKAADMPLVSHLRRSRGGQNLLKIGLGKDIQDAALTDTLTTVAEYRLGEIRSATCFDKTKKTV